MAVEERRQRVLDLVSLRGFISLADLARAVDASESTLRRDLDYWHQQGVLKRTHGGAVYLGDHTSLPALEERSARQRDEKQALARAAVRASATATPSCSTAARRRWRWRDCSSIARSRW